MRPPVTKATARLIGQSAKVAFIRVWSLRNNWRRLEFVLCKSELSSAIKRASSETLQDVQPTEVHSSILKAETAMMSREFKQSSDVAHGRQVRTAYSLSSRYRSSETPACLHAG